MARALVLEAFAASRRFRRSSAVSVAKALVLYAGLSGKGLGFIASKRFVTFVHMVFALCVSVRATFTACRRLLRASSVSGVRAGYVGSISIRFRSYRLIKPNASAICLHATR